MNLYKSVLDIVSKDNIEEATQALLSSNILMSTNKDEYYKSIISTFVQKKELIIKKNGKFFEFDLTNITDVWNIIFLAEYIRKHNTSPELEKRFNSQPVNNVDLINFNPSLPESVIKRFKEAIIVINAIRNSIGHDRKIFNNDIEISTRQLKITIPIEYIHGFNIGRIIAKTEDEEIVEIANNISMPIFEKLNYDIRKVNSFFYNVEPSHLSYLLEICDNNTRYFYKLPIWCFYKRNVEFLEKAFLKNNSKINDKILSDLIQVKTLTKVEKVSNQADALIKILDYLKKENPNECYTIFNLIVEQQFDIDYVFHVLKEFNYRKLEYLRFDDKYSLFRNNIHTIDNIIGFLDEIFPDKDINTETKEFLYRLQNVTYYTKEQLITLYNKYISGNKLVVNIGYKDDITDTLNLLDYFKNKEISSESFKILSVINCDSDLLIDIIEDIMKYKQSINRPNNITKLDAYIFKIYTNNTPANKEDIHKLVVFFYKMLDKNYEIYNFQINLITMLVKKQPNVILDDNIMEKIKYMEEKNILNYLFNSGDIELDQEIVKFIKGDLTTEKLIQSKPEEPNCNDIRYKLVQKSLEEIIEYKNEIIDPNLLYIISTIQYSLIEYNKLDERTKNNLYDILKRRLEYCKKIINLFIKQDGGINKEDSETIVKYIRFSLEMKNYIDIDNDDQISESYLSKVEQYDSFIDEGNKSAIRFYFKHITSTFVYDLLTPEAIRNQSKYNRKNIEKLLQLFNNDYTKLSELPYEFFTYDPEILEVMLRNYNLNIIRSIFGIQQPKVISSLIYCSNIFRLYDPNTNILNQLSQGTIDEIQNNYLPKIFSNYVTISNGKNDIGYLLTKLRNSLVHFRGKPLPNENLILLYDERDQKRNFEMTIPLIDLINLTHTIEADLTNNLNSNNQINNATSHTI